MTETWDPESKCRTDSRVRCHNQDSRTGLTFKLLKLLSNPQVAAWWCFLRLRRGVSFSHLVMVKQKGSVIPTISISTSSMNNGPPFFDVFNIPPILRFPKKHMTPWKIHMLNLKMEVCKVIFLLKQEIFRFHVNFPGCTIQETGGPFQNSMLLVVPKFTKVGVLLISGWAWRPKNPPLLPQAPLEFLVARLPLSTLSIKNSCEQIQSSSSPCQRVYPLEIANTQRLILQNGGSATMFTKCVKSKTEQGDYHCSGKTKEIGKLKLWT